MQHFIFQKKKLHVCLLKIQRMERQFIYQMERLLSSHVILVIPLLENLSFIVRVAYGAHMFRSAYLLKHLQTGSNHLSTAKEFTTRTYTIFLSLVAFYVAIWQILVLLCIQRICIVIFYPQRASVQENGLYCIVVMV